MSNPDGLKQNVPLLRPDFPFNVFHNRPKGRQILHLHWHDEWEIIALHTGRAVFHIGTEKAEAGPGDLLFVNRGLIHSGFALDESPVEYDAIVFHSSLVASPMGEADPWTVAGDYVEGKSFFPLRVQAGETHHDELRALVLRIVDEHAAQGAGYPLAIRSLLRLILVHCLRHYPRQAPSAHSRRIDEELNRKFKRLISYVEDHYADKLSVEQAASLVNLSPYHFCRTFKKMTGKTFVEYVNWHRIRAAEQLLAHSALSVTEIADSVGFGSVNYFCQVYKQYNHCSPTETRKRKR